MEETKTTKLENSPDECSHQPQEIIVEEITIATQVTTASAIPLPATVITPRQRMITTAGHIR